MGCTNGLSSDRRLGRAYKEISPCGRDDSLAAYNPLFTLIIGFSFLEHGVEGLHVIIGEVAQRLVGGGLGHALA